MKKFYRYFVLACMSVAAASCAPKVDFSVKTLPEMDCLQTSCEAVRTGNEWDINVNVVNTADTAVTFKLVLAAEPHIKDAKFMFPGINYNGNNFGDSKMNLPQGWEHEGEPWIFSYDRGSIPSCTISENEDRVFALFASDKDTSSYVSACSMEKLEDGSFRHLIYWPVTEAPLVYDDKLKFSERYDTYLTLAPGESFSVSANACTGKPLYPEYGFATVFPVAFRRISHEVPLCRTFDEMMYLDKAFQDWSRRQDEHGYWYGCILDDQKFRAGYYGTGKSDEGYTVEDYEKHPELNRWHTDEMEQSKHLKPGEYIKGPGRELGFAGQSFQSARLSIIYGLQNNSPEDVDFGLKVLRSWIEKRRYPTGVFKSYKDRGHSNRDASNLGWAICELTRVSQLLKEHGMDASDLEAAADKLVGVILPGVREDGALGSVWNGDTGEVVTYNGDGGGFMLMGLVRYWLANGGDQLKSVIDNAFRYYYESDINHFRCFGGAMDCASIDKEGIHPFFTSAKLMYEATGDAGYLDYARKAAWYFVSWLYIQNPVYDADDDLTVLGIKPAGANIVGVEHPAVDEYGAILLGEFLWLARVDNEPMWRDVAELIWRNGTQAIADENHRVWNGLERPIGSKGEALFISQWSKYHTKKFKRGSINNHLTAWQGVYRVASVYDMTPEDLAWLKSIE